MDMEVEETEDTIYTQELRHVATNTLSIQFFI